MMNKMISPGEAILVRFNLEQIEKKLGHSVPVGVIDYSTLTTMLSPGEVNRICYNIREIERNSGISRYGHTSYNYPISSVEALFDLIKLLFGVGFLIVGLIFGFL